MALTQDQLDQIEFQKASQALNNRMDAIRIAKEILMENDRNKPVGERGVTASDITTFADSIVAYANQ